MQTTYKSDKINPCKCGFKPDHYTLGYGRTPYDIYCPVCKKQTTMSKCKVTGSVKNVIDYWNSHISKLTLQELEDEVTEFRKEQKENTGYDMYDNYNYYWELSKGEVLFKSCD